MSTIFLRRSRARRKSLAVEMVMASWPTLGETKRCCFVLFLQCPWPLLLVLALLEFVAEGEFPRAAGVAAEVAAGDVGLATVFEDDGLGGVVGEPAVAE